MNYVVDWQFYCEKENTELPFHWWKNKAWEINIDEYMECEWCEFFENCMEKAELDITKILNTWEWWEIYKY